MHPTISQPGPETARQAGGDRLAVRAVGLAKSYGPAVALAGLDLHVAAGETVALLGPNGAGKTTTIGLLPGLLTPGRGRVQVHGRPAAQAIAGGLAGAKLQDAGVRAADQDKSRVTLHSSDPDATVSSLVRSDLRWSGLQVGGADLETSFLRLLGDQS